MAQIHIDGANRTRLVTRDGTELFISYRTCVAALVPGLGRVRTEVNHSRTTAKMLGEWRMADAPRKPQAFFDGLLASI